MAMTKLLTAAVVVLTGALGVVAEEPAAAPAPPAAAAPQSPACCPAPGPASSTAATTPEPAPPAPAAPAPAPQREGGKDKPQEATESRASEWTEPADRVAFDLKYEFTDQEGRAVVLQGRVGKPMAVTFFYTRCPMPNQCPLIVATMAKLQESLAEAALAERVQLVLISYDPLFDTPERMKKYGEDRGLRWDNAVMLRPDPERFRALLGEFQVGVGFDESGNIGHYIELIVVDAQGRYVRDYTGTVWDNGKVAADLRRLTEEVAQQHELAGAAALPPEQPAAAPAMPASSTEAIQPEQPAPQEPASAAAPAS